MRLICLLSVVIVFGVVQIHAASSDGFEYELMISALETLHGKHVAKMDQFMHTIVGEPSCPEHADNGVYKLKPVYSNGPAFPAYCDEGWIVISRRLNGTLNFNRTLHDYREGFGDLQGEHWLGLEKIHQITRGGSYELMVVLKNGSSVEKRSRFEGFKVASQFEQYRLGLTRFVAGDAGESIMRHKGMVFLIPDADTCKMFLINRQMFPDCFPANRKKAAESIQRKSWYNFVDSLKSFKEARMMIRAVVSIK